MLASNDVVASAETVQREDEAVTAWFDDDRDDTSTSWDTLNASRQRTRQALLTAYRRPFGLSSAKEIMAVQPSQLIRGLIFNR